MAAATIDEIRDLAIELGSDTDSEGAVARLIEAADGDRGAVEAARDEVARKLHGRAGDWSATAALTLLNKTLVSLGWHDKFEWKSRLGGKLRKP